MGNSPIGAPGARSVFSACSASGRVISTAGVRQDSGSHGESNSILVHMYAPHVCPSRASSLPPTPFITLYTRSEPHLCTHSLLRIHVCYTSHPLIACIMHRALLRTRMPSPPTPTAELLDHHQKEQDMRTRLGRGSVFKRQLQQLNRKHNAPAVTTAEPAAATPTTKRTGTTATSGSSRPKERTMSSNGRLLFRRGSVDSGDDVGTAEAPWQGTAPALARRSISTRTRIRHTASCTHEHVHTGTPDHLQARLTLTHRNRENMIESVLY